MGEEKETLIKNLPLWRQNEKREKEEGEGKSESEREER